MNKGKNIIKLTGLFLIPAIALILTSCLVSKSLNKFSTKNKLTVKPVQDISFFEGKIQMENLKSGNKKPVYLLYRNDSLLFVSNENRITNNEYIYKVSASSIPILMTRATKLARYYTVDTLLFGNNFAIKKTCLYSTPQSTELAQFFLREYAFSADSLTITTYQSDKDVLPIFLCKNDTRIIAERLKDSYRDVSNGNENKLTFFRERIR